MAYSPIEVSILKERIAATLTQGRLTNWQRQFLTDIGGKFDRWGANTRLTEKQEQTLKRLTGFEAKASQPGPPNFPNQAYRAPRPYRRKRTGALAREGRWLARRFVRDFAFASALFAGVWLYALSDRLTPPSVNQLFTNAPEELGVVGFTVTDGDTIRLNGEARGVRLVGFNAPETASPRCSREKELGDRAAARLKNLVRSSQISFKKVACACEAGTEGTQACNFGRSCGHLYVDGRDVGEILISEGLAVSFRCGDTSCPPLPRPWC
ncbi:thermonuclease family protein [Pseudaminobacter arsenicus]|uniref:Thermonuclease family protein n=1 Tax=Borborobacter arsenicus TaxID=1851146 RepID=A0A432UZE7_9HYPH|nr:thermonuclease family protein [Pseudaminobacter arsenicus]RUM95275.1 thermonuclease family protein [Pseudaminobacter arsenicus]